MNLTDFIRAVPDFPQPGVIFRDIMPLLANPEGFAQTLHLFKQACAENNFVPDYIAGIESRGFIFAAPLASQMNAGFVPIRKSGKLPGDVFETECLTEYSQERLAMQKDAIKKPQAKVLIIDDVMAMGGSASSALELMQRFDCEILGFMCLIEIAALKGREKLPSELPVISLLQY